ncbi:hypothetical protein G9A89_021582 [Geosiphon pyriformis]|nr:hypothetical protein G9A89_021582 [Geosiphon pyriformis]
MIHSALAKTKKFYCFTKLLESRHAEESCIRATVNKRIKSFKSDKEHTIRNVLEHPFYKVVLDHLVVENELVLEPSLVKFGVDGIIEDWTRKHRVVSDVSDDWLQQYQSLEYVFDGAFLDVMCLVNFDELLGVVSNLPEDKAAVNLGYAFGAFEFLSNLISSVCSTYDVLHEDNFLVLRGTTTQSSIFAIGSVIENALEKDHELWLAYDSVGWEHLRNSLVRIKMCNRFIRFFNDIHNDCINRVITDFGLLDNGCGYKLNSYFIFRCDRAKSQTNLSFFFATDAFVNDTIWVGSNRSAMQHNFNIASEFFDINNIAINNDKTVAIPMNCRVMNSSLLISGSPISVAKKGESHYYLGIFLFTESLSKPNLAKANSDVQFFANFVLKKTVFDKQFIYLVSAVLYLIIGYRIQFSFVPTSSKSGLSHDFPNNAIYHPSLYNMKTFEQIQTESKVVSCPLHFLQYPVCVKINSLDNFLAGMVHIFSGSELTLSGSLASVFCYCDRTPMFLVLSKSNYLKYVSSLWCYGIAFQLDSCGPVPIWFELSVQFLDSASSRSVCSSLLDNCGSLNILQSSKFSVISDGLLCADINHFSVYMDGSLSGLRTLNMKAGAAVFFEDIDMGLNVGVSGLMFSTMIELQTIALALECVPSSHLVDLFLNSQAALNACKLELELAYPDFRNWYWIEYHHIASVICHKNLNINWHKIKSHLEVSDNECADKLARAAALSNWHLLYLVNEHFFRVGGTAVSSNSRYFVWDVFQSVHYVHWEVGSDSWVVANHLHADIDWLKLSLALHYWLFVAVHKQLYDKQYPSVVCLFYDNVKVLNHAFSCSFDAANCAQLSNNKSITWCLVDTRVLISEGFVVKFFV